MILACVLLSSVSTAAADDDATTAKNQALAQERYDAGKRAYDIGAFDEAITEWKKAYQFFGAPDFLFNIAQAYRQKRDYNEAVFFFNAYLRASPTAPNHAEVTALRDEMVALQERELQMKNAPPREVQPALGGATTNSTDAGEASSTTAATSAGSGLDVSAKPLGPAQDKGASWRLGGIVAGGAGVALAATGLAFALSAQSTEKDLETAAANQEPWSSAFEDREAAGKRNATIGTSLMVVGGIGIVGGIAAYVLGAGKRHERSLAVAPLLEQTATHTSVGLSMGMRF